jgi:hypothetical protein
MGINVNKSTNVVTKISSLNSSTTPILAGNTFTGIGEESYTYPTILVSAKSDTDGILYIEFSPDNSNWDGQLMYTVKAGIPEVQRLVISRKYFRVRFTNTSLSNQTYFRLQTLLGDFPPLISPLNQIVQPDAGSQIVKSFGEEFLISGNYILGYNRFNKFGKSQVLPNTASNLTIDIGSGSNVGSGAYTGFPVSTVDEFEVVSTVAGDIGQFTFTYLASPTSSVWQTATVTLNGTTPVSTGIFGWRSHTMSYNNGTPAGFNAGIITLRHKATPTTIFGRILAGNSQSNEAVYTVPFGYTAKIRNINIRIDVTTTGAVTGRFWVRQYLESPRLRRPFSASNSKDYDDEPYGGFDLGELTDFTLRIDSVTANNLVATGAFDVLLVPKT